MKKCYVVLGPYRTGTSLVSRVLLGLGISAGPNSNLYEATDWNPGGYIQRPDITQFNTTLITHAGGTLTHPPSPEIIHRKTPARLFNRLDLSWMNNLNRVLIKDPRLCYTLYTWMQQEALSNHDVRIVRIHRTIKDAALSALVHYDVKHYCLNSMKVAEQVICSYSKAALWHCESLGLPFFNLSYEELVSNPENEIARLADFCGVKCAKSSALALSYAAEGKSLIATGGEH